MAEYPINLAFEAGGRREVSLVHADTYGGAVAHTNITIGLPLELQRVRRPEACVH